MCIAPVGRYQTLPNPSIAAEGRPRLAHLELTRAPFSPYPGSDRPTDLLLLILVLGVVWQQPPTEFSARFQRGPRAAQRFCPLYPGTVKSCHCQPSTPCFCPQGGASGFPTTNCSTSRGENSLLYRTVCGICVHVWYHRGTLRTCATTWQRAGEMGL